MFRDFSRLGKRVLCFTKITALAAAAIMISEAVKSDIMAECAFDQSCVDNSCQATEERLLWFRAIKFEEGRTTLFVLGSPQLIDGHEVKPDSQETLFGRQIVGGVGNLSEFLDETNEMRFNLVGFRYPIVRQELFIQATGPYDPSPGTLTVERASAGTTDAIAHHGVCNWVDNQ